MTTENLIRSNSGELKTLEEIAPLTPYTYQSLSYLRTMNGNFPKPKGKTKVYRVFANVYDVEQLVEWANAYKAAPRGKKGAVSVESTSTIGIDSKLARLFLCRPWYNTRVISMLAGTLNEIT